MTLFKQYQLNQLWKKQMAKMGIKPHWIDPTKKRKEDYDKLCAICGKDDVLFPYPKFEVSPRGLFMLTPQPQMRVRGLLYNPKTGMWNPGYVTLEYAKQHYKSGFVPFIADPPIRCPITDRKTRVYFEVYNARVCKKCIWRRLGGQKRKLKVT